MFQFFYPIISLGTIRINAHATGTCSQEVVIRLLNTYCIYAILPWLILYFNICSIYSDKLEIPQIVLGNGSFSQSLYSLQSCIMLYGQIWNA